MLGIAAFFGYLAHVQVSADEKSLRKGYPCRDNVGIEADIDHNPLKFADGRMEGYLFPDTYTFTKDMDPEQVCQKIYYNFNEKITANLYRLSSE